MLDPGEEGPVASAAGRSVRIFAERIGNALPLAPQGSSGAGSRDLAALRQRVAKIEGSMLHRLEGPFSARESADTIPLGVAAMDEMLCGGIPAVGLTELRVEETRDGGAGAGFALALAILSGASRARPILWIGDRHAFAEAGFACRAGLAAFGLDPGALLLVRTRRLEEAIWAGEEAARSGAPSLIILEARGNPGRLALEGTRRLHVRAKASARPLLLLRQSGAAETSAAPLRLKIAPHPAAAPADLAGKGRFVGTPVFRVAIEKSRDGRSRQFLLEWNAHEQRFVPFGRARIPHPGGVAAASVERPGAAREAGPVLALRRAS